MRKAECEEKKELIARHEAVYNENFLDTLDEDMPHECWSLQHDVTKTVAVLRSLLWPGFYGYHRNNDLPFML